MHAQLWCSQLFHKEVPFVNLFAEGSEDCLYLNVYTKESPASEIWRFKIINIKIILLNIFKLKNGKKIVPTF